MRFKTTILGAASACAALLGLSATAASAQTWWGQPYGYGQGRYGFQDHGYDGYGGAPVDSLIEREDRLGEQIRRMGYEGRLDRDEAQRAWRMLAEARGQTMHEAREHGRILPGRDYQEISSRLNGVEGYLRHEAREDDDD